MKRNENKIQQRKTFAILNMGIGVTEQESCINYTVFTVFNCEKTFQLFLTPC